MENKVTTKMLKKLSHKDCVKFAVFCAEQVEYLTELPEAKEALEITKKWLDGKATGDECRVAADAAAYAAFAADAAAAYGAANAANRARQAQINWLIEYLTEEK